MAADSQPNGHTNGHTNGSTAQNGTSNDSIPATKLIASFVADANTKQLTPELREKVKEVLIDYIGVVVGALDNADSTEPIYKAISALQGLNNTGSCTVLAKGKPSFLPQYAGLLNAAFGHSMDFDDTYAEGTLHAGVTAISAALTQAELLGGKASSEDLMLAISVGYEVTCRIGRELGYEAYSQGMHNTSTAGIFGSIAAIAVLKRLSAGTIEMAFGLAGSKAAGSMQYLDNGSWNKRLHPGFAVHDAFMCVALAEAGVIGATRIIEGKMGFLHAYSPNPNKDLHRLTAGLGSDWVWLKSSLKPFSACRMTHGFIELCGNVSDKRKGKIAPSDIKSITAIMSPSNFLLIGDPTPNKIHPTNVIDGQFSVYFQISNSLAYGSGTGLKAYQKLEDPTINAISDKITVETDSSIKRFGARMRIEWADGRLEESNQEYPLGEEQHPYTRDQVDEKFLSLAKPVYGARAPKIIEMVDDMERYSVEDLLVVLR